MTKDEVIETLSDLRSQYNCFDDAERKQYHALSMAIKSLNTEAIPVEWIEKYAKLEGGLAQWLLRHIMIPKWQKEQEKEE